MKATAQFTPAPQGYAWPLVGLTLWTVNIMVAQWVGNPSYFTVVGQMLLIAGGLLAMYQRRVPKTYWGQLIQMSQTVLMVVSACSAFFVLAQLLRIVYKIH